MAQASFAFDLSEQPAPAAARWTTLADLADRAGEWRELAATSRYPSAFADPAWVLAWFRHYGRRYEPWPLVLSEADGTLRGLATLALHRARAARTLVFPGARWGAMESLVCAPHDETALTQALAEALRRRSERWDAWRIERLPLRSELARLLLAGTRQLRASAHDVRLQPHIALPGDRESLEARFSASTRSKFRRARRRLAEAGTVERLVRDPAEARVALAALLELHRRRAAHKGERRRDFDERFEEFMGEVLEGLLPDRARLWTLELAGSVIAARLSLLQGDVEHGFMVGMDQGHRSLGPGRELERVGLTHSAQAGVREYDFGPGRFEYKYGWKAVDREMLRAVVASPTPRGRIAGAAAAVELRIRAGAAARLLRRELGLPEQRATAAAPAVVKRVR